jgi:hypothetical protein
MEAFSSIDWISAAQTVLIILAELVPLSHGKESRFMKKVDGMFSRWPVSRHSDFASTRSC